MKKVKMISAALIIMLSAVMFGMSGDGGQQPVAPKKEVVNVSPQESSQGDNKEITDGVQENKVETVKDQFGIDTGMSKGELEKFKKEYLDYQIKNKIYQGDRAFFSKININEIDKFKKYEIGFNGTLDNANINDFIIWSELIIIGSYESFDIEEDKNSTFPVTYKIKIDEILANETEYDSIPSSIIMKSTNIYNHSIESLSELLQKECSKNKRYVFFLSRYDFYNFNKSYHEGKTDMVVKDNCFDPYIFTYLFFSRREINENRITNDPYKSDFDEDNWLEINDLKRNIKEILKINDRENFYKRSYK